MAKQCRRSARLWRMTAMMQDDTGTRIFDHNLAHTAQCCRMVQPSQRPHTAMHCSSAKYHSPIGTQMPSGRAQQRQYVGGNKQQPCTLNHERTFALNPDPQPTSLFRRTAFRPTPPFWPPLLRRLLPRKGPPLFLLDDELTPDVCV